MEDDDDERWQLKVTVADRLEEEDEEDEEAELLAESFRKRYPDLASVRWTAVYGGGKIHVWGEVSHGVKFIGYWNGNSWESKNG